LNPLQCETRALSIAGALVLTACIPFSAVCGQRLKYGLLLVGKHQQFRELGATELRKAALQTDVLRAHPTVNRSMRNQTKSLINLILDLLARNYLHKAMHNLKRQNVMF
jgi:hypothetical protein